MPVPSKREVPFEYILNLPKEKEALDFIKVTLSVNSSHEKHVVMNELFELSRTSTDFNPEAFSKTRISRIKAADFKKIIAEINNDLKSLYETEEYKMITAKFHNSKIIFELLTQIKEKFASNNFHDIEAEIKLLKQQLAVTSDYETVLALYRFIRPFINKVSKV